MCSGAVYRRGLLWTAIAGVVCCGMAVVMYASTAVVSSDVGSRCPGGVPL